MVSVKAGDLFASTAQTLVNTVNCVGVMGKGVALGFKQRFPVMYEDYVSLCHTGQVRLGEPYLYKQLTGPWILNFPTKNHWRSVSSLSDIVAGLRYLEAHYQEWGVRSLAVPPLGCGQGGLEWRVVGPTLYRFLDELAIPVELFAPIDAPVNEVELEFLRSEREANLPTVGHSAPSRIPPSWIVLVEIVKRLLAEPYHWPIGRTTFHKLVYFATVAGLPTGFSFSRGSYGPFSPDVKPMLTKLVNNGLLVEHPLGNMLEIRPGPVYHDAANTFAKEIEEWEHITYEVSDLFLRTRTEQAEIAATVLFAARSLADTMMQPLSEQAVLESVMDWKKRHQPPLRLESVARTIRNLNILRWIDLEHSPLPLPSDAW